VLATGTEVGREGPAVSIPQRGEGFLTASVLVTPEEAQRLTFAQVKGRLGLVVRNPDDTVSFENLPSVTWRSLLNDGERREIQRKRDTEIEQIGAITPRR
jgi:Flp pilus assembly protein CpaB